MVIHRCDGKVLLTWSSTTLAQTAWQTPNRVLGNRARQSLRGRSQVQGIKRTVSPSAPNSHLGRWKWRRRWCLRWHWWPCWCLGETWRWPAWLWATAPSARSGCVSQAPAPPCRHTFATSSAAAPGSLTWCGGTGGQWVDWNSKLF